MNLTHEQLMAGARSVASEQMEGIIVDPDAPLVIVPPGEDGGWRASRDGCHTTMKESDIIIRALVLGALA